jgi:hypothetical protein
MLASLASSLAPAVELGTDAGLESRARPSLPALVVDRCPLHTPPAIRGAGWVLPRLTLLLRHLAWTAASRLRQPIAHTVKVAR